MQSERITLRTQCVNGREYHVTTRYVATSEEHCARLQERITRAVAMSLIRQQRTGAGRTITTARSS